MTSFGDHPVPTPEDRAANSLAADVFFAREVTSKLRARVLAEAGTPQVLLDAWRRDCERVRAASVEAARVIAEREAAERAAARAAQKAAERQQKAAQKQRLDERRRKDAKRSKEWAKQHPDRVRERSKQWNENNPERRREIARNYYHRHKERLLADTKERNRIDPARRAEYQRRYYDTHTEKIADLQRAYRADPENAQRHLEYNREWTRRERRRIDAGLPPRRVHRRAPDEVRADAAAAAEFFGRHRSRPVMTAIRAQHGLGTPPHLLVAWKQECDRARYWYRMAQDPAFRQRVADRAAEASEQRKRERERELAQQGEDGRMDAIARAINQRLRATPPRRRAERPDPAAPHHVPGTTRGGGIER